MTRFILSACLLIPMAGCLTITPVGPMTKVFPKKPQTEAVSTEPIVQQAPRPIPPAMLVTPSEVTENNAQAVIEKLKQELEQDRRSMESLPKPAEVSVIKGRI